MDFVLLDTCIVLHLLRNNDYSKKCRAALANFSKNPKIVLSVVTKAELISLSKQQNWGSTRKQFLSSILNAAIFIDIESTDENLLQAYADIDSYSKRKSNDKFGNIIKGSARKMHKNDLWIAATAFTINIPLITTDGDFDHLDKTMISIIKVN
jgi:tRNA(fMet)-specific endonuclease VapC